MINNKLCRTEYLKSINTLNIFMLDAKLKFLLTFLLVLKVKY